jgi:hypothetical protein
LDWKKNKLDWKKNKLGWNKYLFSNYNKARSNWIGRKTNWIGRKTNWIRRKTNWKMYNIYFQMKETNSFVFYPTFFTFLIYYSQIGGSSANFNVYHCLTNTNFTMFIDHPHNTQSLRYLFIHILSHIFFTLL